MHNCSHPSSPHIPGLVYNYYVHLLLSCTSASLSKTGAKLKQNRWGVVAKLKQNRWGVVAKLKQNRWGVVAKLKQNRWGVVAKQSRIGWGLWQN